MGIAVHTKKAWGLDFIFGPNEGTTTFHIGYTSQNSGQLPTVVRERLPNYGTTPSGVSGTFFQLCDLGVAHAFLRRRLVLGFDISLGTTQRFTNYRDRRFKQGGYSLAGRPQSTAGVGLRAAWRFGIFEPRISLHNLKGFGLGVAFVVPVG
jgi:hypothetical protein